MQIDRKLIAEFIRLGKLLPKMLINGFGNDHQIIKNFKFIAYIS